MKHTQEELEAIVAKQEARKQFVVDMAAIRSEYLPEERETWGTQLEQAKAWDADNAAPTPMLDAMVAASGQDKADLVARILAKAAAYEVAVGAALGKKQAV